MEVRKLIRLQIKELCKEISLPDYFRIVDFNLVWRLNMRKQLFIMLDNVMQLEKMKKEENQEVTKYRIW